MRGPIFGSQRDWHSSSNASCGCPSASLSSQARSPIRGRIDAAIHSVSSACNRANGTGAGQGGSRNASMSRAISGWRPSILKTASWPAESNVPSMSCSLSRRHQPVGTASLIILHRRGNAGIARTRRGPIGASARYRARGRAWVQVALRRIGHPASQRLASRISISVRISEKMAPDDRYPKASHPIFLDIRSVMRVGQAARGRLCAEALCGMARMGAPWRQLPAAYGQGNAVYRR